MRQNVSIVYVNEEGCGSGFGQFSQLMAKALKIAKRKESTSRNQNLRFINPACIAGVIISGSNFKARCGRRKFS